MGSGGEGEFGICVLSWLRQEAMLKGEVTLERGLGDTRIAQPCQFWDTSGGSKYVILNKCKAKYEPHLLHS